MLPSDDDLNATIERSATLRLTFEERPRSTIEPGPSIEEEAERHAFEVLARIAAGQEGIAVEGTLGEGGMGIVRLGRQTSLRRAVAVKTLRDESRDPRSTLRLMREAWITGALEHPNVVPMHELSADERGGPRLVMKRIEGVEWAALMHDARVVESRFHARSLLEWNLSILLQVANAIAFAHARGIVHRDIKPENVMIGAFGEVYVVDWGIAVALRDDGTGLLPLASDAHEMTGTPAYMAPEMLGTPGARITERTDVYLLGAVLFEIINGRAPHEGGTLPAMILRIGRSTPTFLRDCPDELERICRRALDRDPDARFETVVQLRLAIQGYLQHRGATHLYDEARGRLDALKTALAGDGGAVDREVLYDHFGAARFGFQQSASAWRDNDAARDALVEATVLMIEHELAQGDPGAASTLLAELHDARPELTARVAAAKRSKEAEREALERRVNDLDPTTGKRTRTALGLMLGTVWTLFPLAEHHFGMLSSLGRWMLVALSQLALLLALGRWARDTLRRTEFNRRVSRVMMFVFVGQLVLLAGAKVMGLALITTSVLLVFFWFTMIAQTAITMDHRITPAAFAYLLAFLVSARWPELRWCAMSAANLSFTINVVALGASEVDVQQRVGSLRGWRTSRRSTQPPASP